MQSDSGTIMHEKCMALCARHLSFAVPIDRDDKRNVGEGEKHVERASQIRTSLRKCSFLYPHMRRDTKLTRKELKHVAARGRRYPQHILIKHRKQYESWESLFHGIVKVLRIVTYVKYPRRKMRSYLLLS